MNNHFGKFGSLVNVQVHFEGDPASALISYSNNFEADAAMNCSEAVLANRFTRVFYHHSNPSGPKNVKERLGSSPSAAPGGTKVELTGDTLTKTIVNKDAPQSTSPQSNQEARIAEKAAVS